MSQLQQRGKRLVLPLIMGNPTVLGQDAQRIVAAWIAMSVMTSDFFYPDRQAIPQGDRDWLRAKREPPPNTWKIWIARYERGNWVAHHVKNSMAISDEEHVPNISADGIPRPNTQSTTIVFGQLYVHVFSSVFPKLVAGAGIGAKGVEKVAQLWPIREHFIAWPTTALTDREADDIAAAIFKTLDELSRTSD